VAAVYSTTDHDEPPVCAVWMQPTDRDGQPGAARASTCPFPGLPRTSCTRVVPFQWLAALDSLSARYNTSRPYTGFFLATNGRIQTGVVALTRELNGRIQRQFITQQTATTRCSGVGGLAHTRILDNNINGAATQETEQRNERQGTKIPRGRRRDAACINCIITYDQSTKGRAKSRCSRWK